MGLTARALPVSILTWDSYGILEGFSTAVENYGNTSCSTWMHSQHGVPRGFRNQNEKENASVQQSSCHIGSENSNKIKELSDVQG